MVGKIFSEREKRIIEEAWENRSVLDQYSSKELEQIDCAVEKCIAYLDQGKVRIAEKREDGRGVGFEELLSSWSVNGYAKEAILLMFKLFSTEIMTKSGTSYYDKIPLKCDGWKEDEFKAAGFRIVPGAVVRRSAYIAPNCVIMPSFINVGAHVGSGTLIDTWATVGSCAQVGERCHISGGSGIAGVLEPISSKPVIIEDDVFIGARSEIAEGVIVGQGSVISMGVFIGASTRIYNRETREIHYGYVPPYSVVVPGTVEGSYGTSLYAAIIVKQVDENTRKKVAINDLLRDL